MQTTAHAKPSGHLLLQTIYSLLPVCLLAGCSSLSLPAAAEEEFTPLFDGKSLAGWTQSPKGGYRVTTLVENGATNAVIHLPQGGRGNLLTEKQFDDFILRFDFKLTPGANNGLAIRAPAQEGSLAYDGMELQIIDNAGAKIKYKNKLRPNQYHGALYGVVAPARLDVQKPAGQWNTQEVIAQGRRIVVKVNGKKIIDADLNAVTHPDTLRKHPGLLRPAGHIGFLGHNDEVFFKNIRIFELPHIELENKAPKGFTTLFNGRNLAGWRGLLLPPNHNPLKRAQLNPEARLAAQVAADKLMRAHWRVDKGELLFDGQGKSLSTARHNYANYELHCDWKINKAGDSGIYLRGVPQVQIWDARVDAPRNAKGSGGLYNNQTGPADPIKKADHVVGTWNHFRILMIGSHVHVFLNNQLVVKNTPLENFWVKGQPLPPAGPIELQAHGNPLWFKNIYIREIK